MSPKRNKYKKLSPRGGDGHHNLGRFPIHEEDEIGPTKSNIGSTDVYITPEMNGKTKESFHSRNSGNFGNAAGSKRSSLAVGDRS